MAHINYLRDMSWIEFKERITNTKLAIIPTGAFEVYGPHLPLGSDTLVATKISELIAERINSIIGPTLEVGDSSMLNDFPGTITIKPENFKNYMSDVVASLKQWGLQDFLFINPHLGNVPMINQLAFELSKEEGIRCAMIDYWRFVQSHDDGIIETGVLAHKHASEAGTSVMMYLFPELYIEHKVIDEMPKFTDKFPDIIQYKKFGDYTDSGTIGFATTASNKKGEELVNRSVERIVDFLVEEWGYVKSS